MSARFLTGLLLAAFVLVSVGCAATRREASNPKYVYAQNSYGLWLAALKGLNGTVYYLGSEGSDSYFRYGNFFAQRVKAKTRNLNLPSTFRRGEGDPYVVNSRMVPHQ